MKKPSTATLISITLLTCYHVVLQPHMLLQRLFAAVCFLAVFLLAHKRQRALLVQPAPLPLLLQLGHYLLVLVVRQLNPQQLNLLQLRTQFVALLHHLLDLPR